jgi:hypothetical protein
VFSAPRQATSRAIAQPSALRRCHLAFSGVQSLWCRAGRASVGGLGRRLQGTSSRRGDRSGRRMPESHSADTEPRVGACDLPQGEARFYANSAAVSPSVLGLGCRRFRRRRPGEVTRVGRASLADGRVRIAPGQVPSPQIERSGSHQLEPAVSTSNPRHGHAPITTEDSSRRRTLVAQVFELPAALTSGRVLASSASRSSCVSRSSSVRRWSRDRSTRPESSEQSVCTRSLRAASAESSLCMPGRRSLVR